MASKHFIDTGAGVIDADYRGMVKVLLFNHGESDYQVKEGDRVAQLVIERVSLLSCTLTGSLLDTMFRYIPPRWLRSRNWKPVSAELVDSEVLVRVNSMALH